MAPETQTERSEVAPRSSDARAGGVATGRDPFGLAIGVAALGAALVAGRPGLGMALGVYALIAGAGWVLRMNRASAMFVTATFALVPWLVIRDNTWIAISIVCTALLVVSLGAVAGATNRSIWNLSFRALVGREDAASAPPWKAGPEGKAGNEAIVACVSRGLLLAAPVVAIFYSLLASADDVFAALLDVSALPLVRISAFVLAVPVIVPLFRFAAFGRDATVVPSRQRLGVVESNIVLGAVSALFAAFIAVRFATIGRQLDDLGLRDEVRSGFFQLLWVAALTVVLVLALREASGSAVVDRSVQRLGWLTVSLAAVIDGLALYRIADYVQQSFLTPLRFWSFGFGLWLLVALALSALRLSSFRSSRKWFTGALVASWVMFVFAFGALNPDHRIAEHNFVNAPTGEDEWIAVQALIWLSEDATPVIVDNVEVLRPMPNDRYDRMVAHLCATESDNYPRDFSFSRRAAADATAQLCARD